MPQRVSISAATLPTPPMPTTATCARRQQHAVAAWLFGHGARCVCRGNWTTQAGAAPPRTWHQQKQPPLARTLSKCLLNPFVSRAFFWGGRACQARQASTATPTMQPTPHPPSYCGSAHSPSLRPCAEAPSAGCMGWSPPPRCSACPPFGAGLQRRRPPPAWRQTTQGRGVLDWSLHIVQDCSKTR